MLEIKTYVRHLNEDEFLITEPPKELLVYIHGDIDGNNPNDFDKITELSKTLKCLVEGSKVEFRFNCYGGDVGLGTILLNAILDTSAETYGYIESCCNSMASYWFFACDTIDWSDRAFITIHQEDNGFESCNTISTIEFSSKQFETFQDEARAWYQPLLSDQELEDLLKGREFTFNANDLDQRIGEFKNTYDV